MKEARAAGLRVLPAQGTALRKGRLLGAQGREAEGRQSGDPHSVKALRAPKHQLAFTHWFLTAVCSKWATT